MPVVVKTVQRVDQPALVRTLDGEHRVEVNLKLRQRFNVDRTHDDIDVPTPLDFIGGSGRVTKWDGPRPATPADVLFTLILPDGSAPKIRFDGSDRFEIV
jgi:hypothetical protein